MSAGPDLRFHGDREPADAAVNLAVNIRPGGPPAWLADALARPERWGTYPDPAAAREAIAAAHGVDQAMVLPTAGGAEGFTLAALALPGRRPVVVHPQFTEPEEALLQAGRAPGRALLRGADGFRLAPGVVPDDADLVVVGNPTNPTSVLHPRDALLALRRPGRVLLVDEAFMDAVPGEPESLIGPGMAGVVVLRSLTKTWAIPGLRAGYAVGDPELIERMARRQPPWSVATPALDAVVACLSERGRAEAARLAEGWAAPRAALVAGLEALGLRVVGPARAPFVLVDAAPHGAELRETLARQGFRVRRADTFPGLGPTWFRVAVRDEAVGRALCDALAQVLPELTAGSVEGD